MIKPSTDNVHVLDENMFFRYSIRDAIHHRSDLFTLNVSVDITIGKELLA